MDIDTFIRYFLPLFTFIYLLIISNKFLQLKRKLSFSPFIVKKSDRLQFSLEKYKLYISILLILVILLNSFLPRYYWVAIPINYLEDYYIKLFGLVILPLSLIFTKISQDNMKDSYRIGVDHRQKENHLITSGIHKYSRNPIALGMLISLLGFFMVLPNALTLLVLVVGYIIAQLRIKVEETYLLKTHGKEYEEYCKHTRKWL